MGSARLPQYPVGARLRDAWLVMGGRGSGKTRLGAEWVNALVRKLPPFAEHRYGRIALVGETLGDVREVMIEGSSGILSISRDGPPRYEPSRRRLVWDNGAVAQVFSSEDPDSLRGPQFEAAWCDEVAKWKNAEACFDMLQFGLRLGQRPMQLLTTTPKPVPLIRRLVASPDVTVTRMRTVENTAHLAAAFLRAVERNYAGTRLGRQELDGELIEDREDALWNRAELEAARGWGEARAMRRTVVAVDPPATSRRTSDACGMVVAGLDENGIGWVLHDGTMRAAKPQEWAARAVALYRRFEADAIVAEVNQGGDMVGSVLGAVDAMAPVKPVRASRGKWVRAEPVAALYAQGRVRHAQRFPDLEDEMCDFGTDGLSGGRSPDRVDALVWAVTELMLGRAAEPRIRDFA
ncbi:terminase family protein [Chelativorans sp. AA-79]|uniref:DNA-packaging protein n=1 Tax=Chelativorans sp. AA-79 TaxID=3028735 RepID=UPI0023F8AC8F|nr:terminase family protein [Chelativorans sp. AA-79]WEX11939.1 terminase family protein [Chelativorans sp. AA-79]